MSSYTERVNDEYYEDLKREAFNIHSRGKAATDLLNEVVAFIQIRNLAGIVSKYALEMDKAVLEDILFGDLNVWPGDSAVLQRLYPQVLWFARMQTIKDYCSRPFCFLYEVCYCGNQIPFKHRYPVPRAILHRLHMPIRRYDLGFLV